MITKKSMKNILLLVLILFSIPSFAQKIIKGKEIETSRKIEKTDTTITITIIKTRIDTIKTKYSPDIDEVKKETKETLELYLEYSKIIKANDSTITTLNSANKILNEEKDKLDKIIDGLKREQKDIKTALEVEKKEIQDIMALIIKQKSDQYSVQVAEIIKKRAKEHNIPTSDLEAYIRMNKIFFEAKDLLSKEYNELLFDNLDNLTIADQFTGLVVEKDEIIDLLLSYKELCNKLSDEFKRYTKTGASEKNIKDDLNSIKYDYKKYPYLWKKIEDKIKTPNAPINIQCN